MFVVMWIMDSHSIWGPFKTADAAAKWGASNLNSPGWVIRPMTAPSAKAKRK